MPAPTKPKSPPVSIPSEEPVVSPKSEPLRIPTPPIGWPIQYFPKGQTDNPPGAAVVIKHGAAPGLVDVLVHGNTVRPPKGAIWDSDTSERHKAGSAYRMMRGCWRYLPGATVPEEHYTGHESQRAK